CTPHSPLFPSTTLFRSMAQERIGQAELWQGRYEEGYRIVQKVPPEYNPPLWHADATWALIQLGRTQDASALIEHYLQDHPEDRRSEEHTSELQSPDHLV